MTRTERLKQRGKVEKNKKVKKVIKGSIRNIVCFIVGFVYLIYLIIHNFNLLVAKIYSKLPRLMRVAIIYSLVISALYGVYAPNKEIKKVEVKEEVLKINFIQKDNGVVSVPEEQVKATEQNNSICSYGEIECKIYNKAIETGLTKEQALLVVSISKHETGNWTSNAFKNKNNFGGVMCNSGLKKYATFEDGLNGFVNLLKNRYFNRGLDTIEKIGAVYCPVGATNDPTGVNQYWIPNVTNYYNQYLAN